jgi:hypothetical protein
MTLQSPAVARQWLNSEYVGTRREKNAISAQHRGMVFSVRSVRRFYKQDKLVTSQSVSRVSELVSVVSEWVSEWVRGLLRYNCCDILLLEAGSWGRA